MKLVYISGKTFQSTRKYFLTLSAFILILFTVNIANAQTDSIVPIKRSHVNNIIKINTLGLLFGSISLQDEVYFNSKISGALGFNYGISALFLPKYLIDNSSVSLNDMKLTGFSITPELRYYTSSVAPKGFYIAPYFRYSKYKIENVVVNYTSDGAPQTVSLHGDYKQTAGGVMVGSQSRSGKHLVFDWWILGLAYGNGSYEFNAPGDFSSTDIADLTTELNKVSDSFDTSGSTTDNIDGTTTDNINVVYSTSFSIRMGFAIGYIF